MFSEKWTFFKNMIDEIKSRRTTFLKNSTNMTYPYAEVILMCNFLKSLFTNENRSCNTITLWTYLMCQDSTTQQFLELASMVTSGYKLYISGQD